MSNASDARSSPPLSPQTEAISSADPASTSPAGDGPRPTPNLRPDGGEAEEPPLPTVEPALHIGQAVRLRHGIPYLRSAEPMPMLRPADLVDREEVGKVQELRSLGRVAVRFRRGCFLLDAADLVAISES